CQGVGWVPFTYWDFTSQAVPLVSETPGLFTHQPFHRFTVVGITPVIHVRAQMYNKSCSRCSGLCVSANEAKPQTSISPKNTVQLPSDTQQAFGIISCSKNSLGRGCSHLEDSTAVAAKGPGCLSFIQLFVFLDLHGKLSSSGLLADEPLQGARLCSSGYRKGIFLDRNIP
ncbi:hypothetical protein DNTS_030974, partial [Danionella cerebrum]